MIKTKPMAAQAAGGFFDILINGFHKKFLLAKWWVNVYTKATLNL